jgi:hypothetical protein
VGKRLDLVERCFVQMDVLSQRGHVTGLFSDDLGRGVFDNAGAVLIGPIGRTDKIFGRLADAPDTCIALPGCPEKLDDDTGKNWRFKESPALIE